MSYSSANPTLYGHSRPKSKPIPISHSSIHSLSTELSLAKHRLSTDNPNPGRPRGSKTKSLFAGSNKGVSSRAAKDLLLDDERPSSKSKAAEGSGLTNAELARFRTNLEEKAKIYEKLRKGEYIPPSKKQRRVAGGGQEEERLVDFDRKWREEGSGSEPNNSDSESENSEDGIVPAPSEEEIVEYTDEFGRTRTAPKSIAEKHMRKLKQAEEEGGSGARNSDGEPNPNLIYGSIIQTHAFTTAQFSSLPAQLPKVEDLPQTQPSAEEKHYDANAEIRTKGVGFYAFSGDNEQRKKEMEERLKHGERR
ncbi:hypothetical protein L211DRAFT_459138 [Terfezia boudieri ATCC MYA-4762]|uniref:Uncharacterized protein n=1 Tax=Terfezia boudieri ATCC MYA-4762 TaxID=1051890 RepID=A0A3N4LED1_9PEZI|nr:hypothetical protein L211DRAFT_459138 [Terfezia boudieri ATCC MYA-4762]